MAPQHKKDLAIFLHATAGYPPVDSFYKAINAGYFLTWPGLTRTLIRKQLGKSSPNEATPTGHPIYQYNNSPSMIYAFLSISS